MTYKPVNSQSVYVDASIYLPDDAHQLRLKLTDTLRDYATGINNREIGQYYTNEILTGGTLANPTNPSKPRPIYRTLINFGALPATTLSIPHNIPVTSTYQFIKIEVVGNNPNATGSTVYAISLADKNSTVQVTTTDVIITTSVDYSAYTNCFVILDYVKN